MFWPSTWDSSKDHWIIEWFGLEWTLKIIFFQSPCHRQGHLQLHQVAQSPIDPGLEQFQGWVFHHLSWQPVPVPLCPQNNQFLPNNSSKSTLSLKPFFLVLPLHALVKVYIPPRLPVTPSLLCLSLSRISLLIHTTLLVFLPDFLFTGMHHCWAWRRWSLNINQLSGAALPSRALSHGMVL